MSKPRPSAPIDREEEEGGWRRACLRPARRPAGSISSTPGRERTRHRAVEPRRAASAARGLGRAPRAAAATVSARSPFARLAARRRERLRVLPRREGRGRPPPRRRCSEFRRDGRGAGRQGERCGSKRRVQRHQRRVPRPGLRARRDHRELQWHARRRPEAGRDLPLTRRGREPKVWRAWSDWLHSMRPNWGTQEDSAKTARAEAQQEPLMA